MKWPLRVLVESGKDIPSWRAIQTKDFEDDRPTSLIVIRLGDRTEKSGNVRGKNPSYNLTAIFEQVEDNEKEILIDVIDYGSTGVKNTLGTISISIDKVIGGSSIDGWMQVSSTDKKRGQVKIKVFLMDEKWERENPEEAKKWKLQREDKEAEEWLGGNNRKYKTDSIPKARDGPIDTTDMSTEEIESETDRLKYEAMASTERAKNKLEDATAIGADSSAKLEKQGEQLKEANKQLDVMDAHLDNSKRKIRGIKSLGGAIKNKFSKNKGKEKLKGLGADIPPEEKKIKETKVKEEEIVAVENRNRLAVWKGESDALNAATAAEREEDEARRRELFGDHTVSSPSVKKNSGRIEDDELVLQMDKNIESMATPIANLKKLAISFGEELDEQSKVIDELSLKTDKNTINVKKQTQQIQKELK
eukprot:TRINITY_DN4649_c0_g1_i1.p1 TRINITY_DN4649_c0_g1~~TRINITY_DN4649_c0_g1_i1.p1  ORF type:complete len:419 (-),score=183.30 TRINITY_DN4649_c0_g1_i1:70-1326(-)